jgi:hypothetical protein
MSAAVEQLLLGPLSVKTYLPNGQPELDGSGNFVTHPAAFGVPAAVIMALYAGSQDVPSFHPLGYQVGGPGQFNIIAGSLELGVTQGIISQGPAVNPALARLPGGQNGADININLLGDLSMYSSSISSFAGGNINIVSGGSINIGSQELLGSSDYARGIISSGIGNISVVANGTIDVAGSRIAAYDGGNILVRSLEGDVNAGSGTASQVLISQVTVDPVTQEVGVRNIAIAGSGILATTLPGSPSSQIVGDITVETPRGSIYASQGGVEQRPLNGNTSLSPTITLTAGTRDPAHPDMIIYPGNIDASGFGVLGINTHLSAAGDITGLVVARGDSTLNANGNVSGNFFAGGTASFNAGGSISGTIVGVGGVNAGSGKVDANIVSQNISIGGVKADATISTTATATTASQSAAQSAQEQTEKKIADATSSTTNDDDKSKKGAGKRPALTKRVGRVTVILPKT